MSLIFSLSVAIAQNNAWEIMERTDLNYEQAKNLGDALFERIGTGRGTGYKQFQRWLYERKFHFDENGNFVSPQLESQRLQQALSGLQPNSLTTAGSWVELGPWGWNRTSGWNPGTGRLTSVAVHPSNEQRIFVTSPGGGLWRTLNGGSTWTPLFDNVALWQNLYYVTIDPSNVNTVYVGTAGAGVIKSTDGGTTFVNTGAGPSGTILKVLVHPTNSNIVFAGTTTGMWRSTNGGTNWTLVASGRREDIEFNVTDPNTMMASGNDVFRSTDNGLTWTQIGAAAGIVATGRTLVSVTPANANYVYVLQASGSAFGRFYKSVDGGQTFTTQVVGDPASGTNYFGYETNGTGTGGQAGYDMGMAASPANAEEVHIAGIICWKTTNGGSSFVATTAWSLPNSIGYNHADMHGLQFVNNNIYSNSDGGIYKSTDFGDNWTDLSTGLGIRQFYRIATSKTNVNVITGGAQDNGSVARQASGTWVDWLGADGMEGLVSPTNHLNLIGTSQNGQPYRSTNGGASYSGINKPSSGQWVTPLDIHPTNETTLYGGWTGVYKSLNSGSSWSLISGATINTTLSDIAVSQADPNFIYATNGGTLWVTTDDGATWSTRSVPATINDICIDPTNPNKIWIATSNTSSPVYVSTDAGATFTSVSAGLPAIAARAVVVDNSTPRSIYVGLNIGVYTKLETASAWTNFSDNLPQVAVNELDIQPQFNKLRVATYGRGVWESPLTVQNGFAFGSTTPVSASCPVPNTLSNTLSTNAVGTFNNDITLSATAGVPAGTTVSFSVNPVPTGSSSSVTLNNANTLVPGTYNITITGTATGASTQTRDITFIINAGTGPSITGQPQNSTNCTGTSASFTAAASNATSYQWQVSTNNGGNWTDINTATLASLSVAGVTATDNGKQYRCRTTNTCGSSLTSVATLTVLSNAAISANASDATICTNAATTLTIAATGGGTLQYQWASAPSCAGTFSNILSATGATLNVAGSSPAAAYRVTVSNACNTVVSNCAAVTVVGAPAVANSPINQEVCANGNVSFSASGNSAQTVLYQWQISTNGGASYTDIASANTSTLNLSNVAASLNNNRYRCQLTTNLCNIPTFSAAATLTVRTLPTLSLTASKPSILPTETSLLTATPSASNGGVVTLWWNYQGTGIINNANTLSVAIDKIGNYSVGIREQYSSGLVCTAPASSVDVNALPSTKLFIFPTPNDGNFRVTYYNSTTNATTRNVTVYDAKGSRVFTQNMPIAGPYTILNVALKTAGKGLHIVVLSDASGKTIATGKVVVK